MACTVPALVTVLAVILREWWTLAPLAIAAGASALVIVFAVDWSLPSTAPEADKQLAAQTTTAVATFLVAAFVSWSADQNEPPASSRSQKAFKRTYLRAETATPQQPGVRYFRPGSRGELLVQSPSVFGIQGWGHTARMSRARGIAEEMRTGAGDP